MFLSTNIIVSKTEITSSSKKLFNSAIERNIQSFSFGPFLNIFSGNIVNSIIKTDFTTCINSKKNEN